MYSYFSISSIFKWFATENIIIGRVEKISQLFMRITRFGDASAVNTP
jgi:hypothetical protein